MKAHYRQTVIGNEASIEYLFTKYDPKEKAIMGAYGYPDYGNNSVHLEALTSGYYCPDSRYFRCERILTLMNEMIDYLERSIRRNYTCDNMESDFYAGPILVSIYMSRSYRIMEKYAKTEAEIALKKRLFLFLFKPAIGIYNGGIITPNHRWMAASSTSMLHSILGLKCMKERTDLLLREGIDIDENGEYTERSPMYNKESDCAMIIIAEELKDPKYLEYVKRNLDLMFIYFEPNMTMFTQNSNRKDKQEGDVTAVFYPYSYYYLYLHMSYLTGNAKYAYMADEIFRKYVDAYKRGIDLLWMYELYPGLLEYEPKMEEYDKTYHIFHRDIVRKRKDDFSVTLLTRSPNFLFVQKGDLRCFVRICASFFAVAQFVPEKITRMGENTYYMSMKAHGEYYGPMSIKPETPKWTEMDHSLRPVVNAVDLEYFLTITLEDKKVSLDIKTQGVDNVPYKVEFCLSPSCTVRNKGELHAGEADKFLSLDGGDMEIEKNNDRLVITDSFSRHTFHNVMRGSVAPSKGSYTIYYTDFTDIDKRIDIIAP